MSLSPLRRRKAIRAFYACDLTGDGVLTVEDWELRTKRTAASIGIVEGTEEYAAFAAQQRVHWEQYAQVMDANQDGQITLDEWVTAHEQVIWAPQFREMGMAQARKTVEVLWALLDRNGDGNVDEEEFFRFNRGYVASPGSDAWISALFHRLDRSGKGYLSTDDLMAAMEEWAFSEDENAPGNGLCGPF